MAKLVTKTRYFIQSDDELVIYKEYFFVQYLKDWNYYIAQIKRNSRYGILNSDCEEISDFEYLGVNPTSRFDKDYTSNSKIISATAKVGPNSQYLFVLLNGCGDKFNNETYDYAEFSNYGYHLILSKNKKYGVVDYKNNIIIPFEYDNIYFDSILDRYCAELNNKKLCLDTLGKVL